MGKVRYPNDVANIRTFSYSVLLLSEMQSIFDRASRFFQVDYHNVTREQEE